MSHELKKDVVYQRVKNDITSGKYPVDWKLPRELDFAREHGVSFITMRSALARLEEDGLIVRIPSKGTFVRDWTNPVAETSNNRKLLLLLSDFGDNPATENLFNRRLILGAVQQGYLSGYSIINDNFNRKADLLEQCRKEKPVGIIWDRPTLKQHELIQQLHELEIPQVLINRQLPELATVACNYPNSICQAVRYLRNIGHRHIGLIDLNPEEAGVFKERQEAFCEQLRFSGIEAPENYLITRKSEQTPFWLDIGRYMHEHPEISAVVVSIVLMADFQRYLEEELIAVPAELTVIQWGENLMFNRETDHPYSILTEPRTEVGHRAVELIDQINRGEDIPTQIQLLDGELIVRKGCALPKNFKQKNN